MHLTSIMRARQSHSHAKSSQLSTAITCARRQLSSSDQEGIWWKGIKLQAISSSFRLPQELAAPHDMAQHG